MTLPIKSVSTLLIDRIYLEESDCLLTESDSYVIVFRFQEQFAKSDNTSSFDIPWISIRM